MSEFLAEAQVRIAPDTTGFRAQLEAELLAATRGLSVAIPVTAATLAGPQLAAQTAAVQQASSQLSALAAAQGSTTTATAAATRASTARTAAAKLEARAAHLLAVSQEEVLNATTAVGAAQITATRAAAALAAARRAEAALTTKDTAATAAAVKQTLALAEAENLQAQAALRAAKATEAHGASMSFLGRGAGATGLSILGVRGATLAANSAFLAGAAAAAAFAKSIQIATSFSQELNVFKVTVGATADEMDRVSATARALGRDITLPGVNAQDAAEAMTELAKAGLSVQDSLDGARGVLQLATAAQLSNADATTLTASALNSFGLAGDQAVHVADLLANAANNAQGGIEDMGLALRQSAGVARQVGFSIEDTVSLLTLLARNGLQGSDAGTALRTSLIRLINPTTEARKVLKDLNIQLRDQAGNLRPEVFAEFAVATARMTKAQQDARAAIVFGQDAIRAEAILGREGAKGLDTMRVALEKQGTAARVAGARMTGLAGDTASLENSLSDLGLTIGNVTVPALAILARGLNDLAQGAGFVFKGFSEFNDLISGQQFDAADAGIRGLTERLAEVSDERERFTRDGHFVPPAFGVEAADLTKRIVELGKAAQATGNSNAINAFFDAFKQASPEVKAALRDGVITPLEAVELKASDIGRAFLKAAPKEMFSGLGAAARSGLEDAGAAVKRGVNDLSVTVHSGIEDAARLAVVQARESFGEVGDAIGDSMVRAARASIRRNQGQLAGLEEEMNKILASGASPQEQIANLRRQAARQERIIAAAGPNAAGAQLKARRRAQESLAQINQQIASLEDQIQADQDKAARDAQDRRDKIQKARDDADQAFIDTISGKLAGIDNRILAAESRDAVATQLKIEKQKRDALLESISGVRTTVQDAKKRASELQSLTRELIQTNAEIRDLTKQQREAEVKRIEDARNAITEKLAKQTQLAELRGNDQAQLVAINRQIADARKRVKAAQAAKKGVLDEQIALQQLINARKDLIEKITGADTGGSSLADFLRQNTELFGQIAPNLGRVGIDPLSGFDFSKSLTATLSKLQAAARGTLTEVTPSGLKPPGPAGTDASIQRLIDALDRNTEATRGNTTVGGPGMNRIAAVAGQRGEAMARFWENRQARVQTETAHGI